MKDKNLLKTIIICVSVVICVCVASYVYYEANRYWLNDYIIVDKYTKDYYVRSDSVSKYVLWHKD